MYVSLSPGIKYSISDWSIEAMVLYIVSVVPSTATCLGLGAKVSNLVTYRMVPRPWMGSY